MNKYVKGIPFKRLGVKHLAIPEVKRNDLLLLRLLIAVGIFALFHFLLWYFQPEHIGHSGLFILLTVALAYKGLHVLFEWYHLIALKQPKAPQQKKDWTVDLLTTYVPGEPYDMVEATLRAMVAVRYPHTTYLCDEGNDPYLKKVCDNLGVVHVYRGEDKTGAKAGNINYALRHYATGAIAVILDPDHIPTPEFLDRVLPHFEDPQVGYVQSIQAYHNVNESFVAKGAAEQTYMFYGPLMMGMHRYGTVQAIGANCAFRRTALDSIGGHATGLTEDMHTSMRMHAKKWTSVYIPEALTRGQAPANLSSYYKQQLKWSRGSFELLFKVYPKLFRKFTWRQGLHYGLMPLYFFYGLIALIDLSVPVYALLSTQVPLLIEFQDFVFRITPFLLSMLLVRLYAQRYVLDQHEGGFHILGGLLRVGTWWVYLLGFIYSLLRIKVPYLPTPKEGKLNDEWNISLPNLAMMGISLLAIAIGLQLDWSPFSLLMAGFAGVNVTILGAAVLIGQQKLLRYFFWELNNGWLVRFRSWWYKLRHRFFYRFLRSHPTILVYLLIIGLLPFLENYLTVTLKSYDDQDRVAQNLPGGQPPENRFFSYWNTFLRLDGLSSAYGKDDPRQWRLYRIAGLNRDTYQQLSGVLYHAEQKGVMPYVEWSLPLEGWSPSLDSTIAEESPGPTARAINLQLAELLRDYQQPLMLDINRGGDIPFASEAGEQSWMMARRRLIDWYKGQGVTNVGWAWTAPSGGKARLPRKFYVDALRLSAGASRSGNRIEPIFDRTRRIPFILELDAVTNIGKMRPGHARKDKFLGYLLKPESEPGIHAPATIAFKAKGFSAGDEKTVKYLEAGRGISIDSVTGTCRWIVDGKPFYVKGIAYNPEHDWRDGHWPLTRDQLNEDFQRIKDMGANTIRRYGPTVYDRNILKRAAAHDLRVLYGFWFDPKIDYRKDARKVAKIKREVLSAVRRYRNQEAVLAWVVGNETWGGLKHYFDQPYLSEVRMAYVDLVEELTREIKRLDAQHPVLTALEYSRDLPGALDDFRYAAPSIDAVGVNTYYQPHFERLDGILREFYPERPYLVSEFGPKGYWDEELTPVNPNRTLVEQSSFEKARMYARHWSCYIEDNRAYNLGGVAFCWRDRMEGTASWFGVTDHAGRFKPAYFSLKEVWTGKRQEFPLTDIHLLTGIGTGNDSWVYRYRVVSSNNKNLDLNYEWRVLRNDFLWEVDRVKIKAGELNNFSFRLINNYYEYIRRTIYPVRNGRDLRYLPDKTEEGDRIYLYVYDDQNHVVTASCPYFPRWKEQ